MRFLANENFPKPGIHILRSKGYEVISIQEQYAGLSDKEVIAMAIEMNLIILTFDRDYGELIFRFGQENPPSVVFFRYKGEYPTVGAEVLLNLLSESELNIEGAFTVIEKESVRQRFYRS